MTRPLTPDEQRRAAGFRIEARPAQGPAVWRRERRVYPEDVALRIAQREAAEKAALRGGT